MSTQSRSQGKEFYSNGLVALQRIEKTEKQKDDLSHQADAEIFDEEFIKFGKQIQQLEREIAAQVEVAFNNFKDAMRHFTEGRKLASSEGNAQEW